jgi:hypothetical protein
VNWSAPLVALVPAGVVTVTSTLPAAPAGAVAVTDVADPTVKLAFVAPNFTDVAPVNPVPVIVTAVPPAVDPLLGVTPETVGAAVEPPHVTTIGVELAWAFTMLAFEM